MPTMTTSDSPQPTETTIGNKRSARKVLQQVAALRRVKRRLRFPNNPTRGSGVPSSSRTPTPPTLNTSIRSIGGSTRSSHPASPSVRGQTRDLLLDEQHHGVAFNRSVNGTHDDDDDKGVVHKAEGYIRQVCLLLGAYCLGSYHQYHSVSSSETYLWIATKALEYSAVAWITCIGILLAAAYQRRGRSHSTLPMESRAMAGLDDEEDGELLPLLASRQQETYTDLEAAAEAAAAAAAATAITTTTEVVVVDEENAANDEYEEKDDNEEDLEILAKDSVADQSNQSNRQLALPLMPHPHLDPFFVMDSSGQRIIPNTSQQLHKIDTEYFQGNMLVLIQLPDNESPLHMQDKQRRFEFQFQIQLKKIPTGRVFFACELDQPVKLGMIQRAFVGAAMAFVKATNNSFHYSMGVSDSENSDDSSSLEKAHMAFPVEEGMNRLVVTPPGEEPPPLGQDIYEDAESIKRRTKKGERVDWNMQDTYTLSLWSAYVDFLDWNCLNMPGIRPFALSNVIGRQHISLLLYEIPEDKESGKHYKKDTNVIVQMELSNAFRSGVGPVARQWLSQHGEELVDGEDRDTMTKDLAAEEEDAAAELGEGIYVRSGDSITLRESSSTEEDAENGSSAFVTYAGGFAVLQETSSSTVIIEKVEKSRKKRSKLIRSGDTVMFKLVTKGRKSSEEFETRYLSIHRGWWLKWVANAPVKNGFFTIFTHETEYSDRSGEEVRALETQSSYLTLGGSFWLQHKRWSKYHVGVAPEGSATYGGRMLGLYTPKNKALSSFESDDVNYQSDEGDLPLPDSDQREGEKTNTEWLLPLQLRACECFSAAIAGDTPSEDLPDKEAVAGHLRDLVFSREHYRMDVPVWLEVMNRTDRIRQLVYAVRVSPQDGFVREEMGADSTIEPFTCLRPASTLSQVIKAGLNWRNSSPSPRRWKASLGAEPTNVRSLSKITPDSAGEEAQLSLQSFDDDESSDGAEWVIESSDDGEGLDSVDDNFDDVDAIDRAGQPKRSKQFIGKLAKSGKSVVKHSVKVGKGTVSAGKSIMRRPKNPPSREPKSSKTPRRKTRRRREQDLHVSVKRNMKRIEKEDYSSTVESPSILAGELSAPEQSRRSVSNMLSSMSSLPSSSTLASSFSALLVSQMEQHSEHEDWFLAGGRQLEVEIGVVPSKDAMKGALFHDCLVARCLWESHWREEWCGLYEKGLSFYAPLTDMPCLEISFEDIQSARLVDAGARSPLPGYPLMAIETAWICHYVAFVNEGARDTFSLKIAEVMTNLAMNQASAATEIEKEMLEARFWQGFQSTIDSSLSSGEGKWARVESGGKPKGRVILNNRRMDFDLEPDPTSPTDFVEDLLSTSLSFSLKHLKENPEALIKFLDSCSRLRNLSLRDIDPSTTSSFCLFVNLYHCLLQHSLLLCVNGPLHKRSCGHFMRTSCYEIGGDVFSLAELRCCVIRGNMSRPNSSKAPYIEPTKKSGSYLFYALGQPSPRVNFLLNTGDVACTREVPVLSPDHLDEQLNIQAAEFLRQNVTVDGVKRVIVLPKVCEVYRNDFSLEAVGAANVCLRYCLSFLDEAMGCEIRSLLKDEPSVSIKYRSTPTRYHTFLRRRELVASTTEFEKPSYI